MEASQISTSYCGPAPLPDDLLGRWNFDPVLIAAMVLAGLSFAFLRRNATQRESGGFVLGMVTLIIIFISPLCALTVSLFSARVVHHALLVAIAAPLLAMALPRLQRNLASLAFPLLALHTVIFWLWHAPDFYAVALADTAVYWLMQISLLGSAMLLWAAVLGAPAGSAIAVLLGATAQMGFLGALLVFASQPLYLPHFLTTQPFGFDPLVDQQLAGLVMWVPASLPYLAIALVRLLGWLRQPRVQPS